jgi:(E)-4-hydroxy-3-methyl-but-2-enyl pyrophosphate reductase
VTAATTMTDAPPRTILLAAPRGFCAGVDRAIKIVELALDAHGPPVYVRHAIVHNTHVVADLEARGAVFVEDESEVPEGELLVFSAHGVPPQVRERSAQLGLDVLDATCPLVTKVHYEAREYAARGYDIVLIGHEGHQEVIGTMGHAPGAIHLVETPEDVADLQVRDPDHVAYISQTTLSVDDANRVIAALTQRFPNARGPRGDDICYATQNRQDATRVLRAPDRRRRRARPKVARRRRHDRADVRRERPGPPRRRGHRHAAGAPAGRDGRGRRRGRRADALRAARRPASPAAGRRAALTYPAPGSSQRGRPSTARACSMSAWVTPPAECVT